MTVYIQLCLHAELMGCSSSPSESTEMHFTSSHTCSNSSCLTALFSTLTKQLEATILSYKRLPSSEVMFLNSYAKDLIKIGTIILIFSIDLVFASSVVVTPSTLTLHATWGVEDNKLGTSIVTHNFLLWIFWYFATIGMVINIITLIRHFVRRTTRMCQDLYPMFRSRYGESPQREHLYVIQ